MAFKMKGFSGFKDTSTDKMMSLLPKPKINKLPAERKKPRKKPVNAVGVGDTKKPVRPPQPPKPGTVEGLTKFQYDMKPITSTINRSPVGRIGNKINEKIKDYFFTK